MIDIPNISISGENLEFGDVPIKPPFFSPYQPMLKMLQNDWNKQLSEFGSHRRSLVRHAVINWDDIDNSPDANDLNKRSRRQQLVMEYDIFFDLTQENRTYVLIHKFIRELKINIRTTKNRDDDAAMVIIGLRNYVIEPLKSIAQESIEEFENIKLSLHKSTQWSFWAKIYWFWQSIQNISDQAKESNNFGLALVLDEVAKQIEKILFVEQWKEYRGYKVMQTSAEGTKPFKSILVMPKTTSKTKDKPPGITEGMVAITKLAISAAWQIECSIGRKASAKEVIKMLQEWVDSKKYEDLIYKIPNGVTWMTSAPDEKKYDIDACRATLKSWHKNRA